MRHGDGRVGKQRHLFLESVAVLRQYLLLCGFLFLLVFPFSHRLVRVLTVFDSLLPDLLDLVGLLLLLGLFLFPLLFALCVSLAWRCLLEALIGFFEERHEVVEFREVEVAVDLQLSVVGDGVAKVGTVLKLRAPLP